jgi:hypothetical protein
MKKAQITLSKLINIIIVGILVLSLIGIAINVSDSAGPIRRMAGFLFGEDLIVKRIDMWNEQDIEAINSMKALTFATNVLAWWDTYSHLEAADIQEDNGDVPDYVCTAEIEDNEYGFFEDEIYCEKRALSKDKIMECKSDGTWEKIDGVNCLDDGGKLMTTDDVCCCRDDTECFPIEDEHSCNDPFWKGQCTFNIADRHMANLEIDDIDKLTAREYTELGWIIDGNGKIIPSF